MTCVAGLRGRETGAHPYTGRLAALATMHGKEAAIAPPLARLTGLVVSVPAGIDTDSFGTFSGEIDRPGTIAETAVAKARMAMEATGLPLGIASEGSFGPHPDFLLIPAGIELMVLVDAERDIAVSECRVEPKTNFGHTTAVPGADLDAFLIRSGFPSHALVVRPNAGDLEYRVMRKGVADTRLLQESIVQCARSSLDGLARVETDMRAHVNPTRMKSIRRLALTFARRLATLCPACASPGFGPVGSVAGLPCGECGLPSILVKHQVLGCPSCAYRQDRLRDDGQVWADPRFCPYCNP